MEWLIAILTIVFTPSLTLLGTAMVEKSKLKGKKMELEDKKNTALADCQAKHAMNLDKVKSEFNERLDGIDGKLDEIKMDQLRLSMTVAQLQTDVQKHNNVIERTYNLENRVTAIETREKIS